jgi:hypothetical protein
MTRKFLAVLLLAGLAWGAAMPAAAEPVGPDNAAVQALADPILDAMLQGFQEGDYEVYSQCFDDALKNTITPKKFQQSKTDLIRSLGDYQGRTYLGFMEKGKNTVVLWKGRFSKSADDVLIRLALVRRGDQVKTLGMWFQ